jgi:hypothetical protein
VPVDCEVFQGGATITIEHLTGEVKPLEAKVGDRVPGGARNLDGRIIVKVYFTVFDVWPFQYYFKASLSIFPPYYSIHTSLQLTFHHRHGNINHRHRSLLLSTLFDAVVQLMERTGGIECVAL